MSRIQRIAICVLLAIVSIALIYISKPSPNQQINIVLCTALIMIVFQSLLVEHFFTKPSDVLASSISILLLLIPMEKDLRDMKELYWILISYCSIMFILSLISLITLTKDQTPDSFRNKASSICNIISSRLGKGSIQYFLLFFFFLLAYINNKSLNFFILLMYSLAISLIDPKKFIIRSYEIAKGNSTTKALGTIIGIEAGETYTVHAFRDLIVNEFEPVEFALSEGGRTRTYLGMALRKYRTDEDVGFHLITIAEIDPSDDYKPNYVYRTDKIIEKANEFVGLISEGSTIGKIRFLYHSSRHIRLGDILVVHVQGSDVLYQITEAITKTQPTERQNEIGFIIGEATQIGIWDSNKTRFDLYGWVPEISAPVYAACPQKVPECPHADSNECSVGCLPSTGYPLFMDCVDAITHHIGIFGATGSGKSVFARELIKNIANKGTKVICVDFTGEYFSKLSKQNPVPFLNIEDEKTIIPLLDIVSLEMAKFRGTKRPDNRDDELVKKNLERIRQVFEAAIKLFIESKNMISIFTLPGIANSQSSIEFTKSFFESLFSYAKENSERPNICTVLEEAHTVVPEWNFAGTEEKGTNALVNTISQIALQGRKYNVGFVVIAQRTANVSKTVITQCNSIIAFQQFDNTSKEFLANYLGYDMAQTLPHLRQRQAIASGKAFRSSVPLIFEVPNIVE